MSPWFVIAALWTFAGAASEDVLADDIPVAKTPPGYWKTMPAPVLARCTEALADGAIDMRGTWKVVESTLDGEPSERFLGSIQRIEQCGNRVELDIVGVSDPVLGSFVPTVDDLVGVSLDIDADIAPSVSIGGVAAANVQVEPLRNGYRVQFPLRRLDVGDLLD